MSTMTKPVMIVLSGGQDSTTCAYWARHVLGASELHGITFDYGQLHAVEIEAATSCAQALDFTSHEVLGIGPILKGNSPLINSDRPLQQYADHASLPGGLEDTFVPARNMLFLTLAANRAYCLGIKDIVAGVCQEDSGGYPDCREIFIIAIKQAMILAHDRSFEIHTPLMHMTKAESVTLALTLPGAYQQLAYSHTAYDGAFPPTGHDHATLLRGKGFEGAGVPDPLVVRAWLEGVMALPTEAHYDVLRDLDPTTTELSDALNLVVG